jgi:hypothetical protein
MPFLPILMVFLPFHFRRQSLYGPITNDIIVNCMPQTITYHQFKCDFCGYFSAQSIIGPTRCRGCGKKGCQACVPHYYYCKSCWGGMNAAQREKAKLDYKKEVKEGLSTVGKIFLLLLVIIAIGFAFIGESVYITLGIIFVGLIIFGIAVVKYQNRGLTPMKGKSKVRSSWNLKDIPSWAKIIMIILILVVVIVIIAAISLAIEFS